MDLDSRLASLSLAEIASMLSPKQQEVLLASISVAARFIQQLQAEEQMQADERLRVEEELAAVVDLQYQDHMQRHHPQATRANQNIHHTHLDSHQTSATTNNNNNNISNNTSINNINNTTTTTTTSFNDLDDDLEDEFDEDDDDNLQESLDSSSTSTFRGEHHSRSSNISHHHRKQHSAYDDDGMQADEKDLLTIRQFAEELKHRRKAIRLSQKGAAQSLRAFTEGEQPCTDAIIYHFENLQLEPERAMQLIPLLRDWLEWAEKFRLNGKQLPQMSAVTKVPRERKRKVVLFNEKAKQYLEDAFLNNNHPDRYQLDVISQELNIPTRSIRKWFTNRRQRKRFAEKFSPVSL